MEFLRSHVVAIVLEVEEDSFLDQSSDCHQLLLSFMDEFVLAYEQFVRDEGSLSGDLDVSSDDDDDHGPRHASSSASSSRFGDEAAENLFRYFWERFPHLEKLEQGRRVFEGNAFFSVNDDGMTEMVTLKEYLRAAVRHRLARPGWTSPRLD